MSAALVGLIRLSVEFLNVCCTCSLRTQRGNMTELQRKLKTTSLRPFFFLVLCLSALAILLVGAHTTANSKQNMHPTEKGPDLSSCRQDSINATIELRNGVSMPRLGFGTAGLGDATQASVREALNAGVRHIDTAAATEYYREAEVGNVLKESSSALRQEVFVCTKIHPRDLLQGERGVMQAFERSVHNVGTTSQVIDLVLLHAPYDWFSPASQRHPISEYDWQAGWRALESLYNQGRVRSIGVSNFNLDVLQTLIGSATLVPHVIQSWADPYNQQRALRALCAQHGIAFVAYSSLGGQYASHGGNTLMQSRVLGRIADKHGTSVAQVVLSWVLQSGMVAIPRSSNPLHIRENAAPLTTPSLSSKKCKVTSDGDEEGRRHSSESDATAKSTNHIQDASDSHDHDHDHDHELAGGGRDAANLMSGTLYVFLDADDMREIDALDGAKAGT